MNAYSQNLPNVFDEQLQILSSVNCSFLVKKTECLSVDLTVKITCQSQTKMITRLHVESTYPVVRYAAYRSVISILEFHVNTSSSETPISFNCLKDHSLPEFSQVMLENERFSEILPFVRTQYGVVSLFRAVVLV